MHDLWFLWLNKKTTCSIVVSVIRVGLWLQQTKEGISDIPFSSNNFQHLILDQEKDLDQMTNLIPPASCGQPHSLLAVGLASKGRCPGGIQPGAQSPEKQKLDSTQSVDVSPRPIFRAKPSPQHSLSILNYIFLSLTKKDLLGAPTPPNPEIFQ